MRIESLSKSYGEKRVLDNFSLSVSDGIYAICGPSGCGKTTLLRIICGLEKADSGSVTDTNRISVSFQEARLLPWIRVSENVSVCERTGGLGVKILNELGLGDALSKSPSELSGGMKRRVSIARALCKDFDTLLLDEPFSELDEKTAEEVFNVIEKYTKGKTVLIITHDTKFKYRYKEIVEI